MKVLVLVPLLTAAALCGGGCSATSQHGESLVTPLPPGWVRKNLASTDGLERIEMVPPSTDSESSGEMVETQTFKGGVEEGDPVHFAEWLATSWKDDCPGAVVGEVDTAPRIGYPAAFWRMDCPRQASSGRPSHVLTLAIEGSYAFYTVQKSWSREPDANEVASWTRSFFGEVRVCDDAKPEHPCRTGSTAAR